MEKSCSGSVGVALETRKLHMPQDVFDNAQLSAMTRVIDQLVDEFDRASGIRRDDVAHAVFMVASGSGVFDAAKLADMARERLAAHQ